jgi:hypothetical protein
MKNKAIAAGIVILFTSFTFIYFAWPQEQGGKLQASSAEGQKAADNADEDAFTVETISGEVSGMAKNSISIIYDRDYDAGTEYEVLIPIAEETAFKHKKSLQDIKVGDLVSVEYEKPAENSKRKAKAKTINFVQSGVRSLATESFSSEGTKNVP